MKNDRTNQSPTCGRLHPVLAGGLLTLMLISGCERAPLQPSDTQVRANLNTLRAWPGSPLPASAARFRAVDASLVPEFADPDEAVTTRATLPAKANGQTHIEDRQTGLGIDISLVGANATAAQVVDGYVVYPRGHELGWVYQRAEPSGLEDYLVLDAQPVSPSIAYQVKLGPHVAGLRLVENQLEMLDASGAPRLRLAPPYLVGNDGVRTDALLAVEGCAVVTDPAGPWGRAVKRSGPNTCRIIVSWANDGVTYPAVLDPRWQTTGSLSVARQDHNLVYLPLTGKVLAVGGRSSPTSTTGLASAELFDNNTRTWSATSSMTGGRWSASATLLGASANGTTSQKVLIAGGINGTASVNTAQLYNQTAGTWSTAGTLNAPRHLHTATLLNDGRVLVCGGMNGTTLLTSAALYNPAAGAGSWAATTGPIPPPGWRSGTATLIKTSNNQLNNKVLLAGGNNGTSTLSSVFLFDPAQSAFSTLAAMPSPRESHTAVALSDGRILFAGGKNGSATLASAVIFDPSWGPGSWNATGSLTTPRWGHAMNLLPSGVLTQGLVLVSGGSNGTSTLSSTEYWNGVNNGGNWATDGVMVAPVQQHASVALGKSLLVAGGAINNGATTVSAAEIYDPSIGLGCTLGSQCASGFCVAGVCCDSACNGGCGACNLAGHVGTCTPVVDGPVCRPAAGLCDVAETCDGSSLACPADALKSSTEICRPSCGDCDAAEKCTGTSVACPADKLEPATTECRPSAGDCDVAESCTGTSATCPDDMFEPAATECRAAVSECDVTEMCSGSSADCSLDEFRPDGTLCGSAGDACAAADSCQAGTCKAGKVLDCNDNNLCTLDSCDPASGCVHAPDSSMAGKVCTRNGCSASVCSLGTCLADPLHAKCLSGQVPGDEFSTTTSVSVPSDTRRPHTSTATADGSWAAFYSYQFGDVNRFAARIATRRDDDVVEVHLDSVDGTLIAKLETLATLPADESDDPKMDDGASYQKESVALLSVPTGTHDVYLVFKEGPAGPWSGTGPWMRLDWFEFYKGPRGPEYVGYVAPGNLANDPILKGTPTPAVDWGSMEGSGRTEDLPDQAHWFSSGQSVVIQPSQSAASMLKFRYSLVVSITVTWTGGKGPLQLGVYDEAGNLLVSGVPRFSKNGGTVSASTIPASLEYLVVRATNNGNTPLTARTSVGLWPNQTTPSP